MDPLRGGSRSWGALVPYNLVNLFLIKARIKNEEVSEPLLKKITWEEVKLMSVVVSQDD